MSEQRKPKTTITINVFEDGSLDVQRDGAKLNSLEWLGALAGALIGTTTFNRDDAAHAAPPAEQEAQR